jgi:dCTP deaminase
MIVNGQSLLAAQPIRNMLTHKASFRGFSHGLTECGYDIRIAETVTLFLGRRFVLASSMEYFNLPCNLMGRLLNKSTWARLGIDASMTTNLEPGWRGYLTLELRYSGWKPITIHRGTGIAQVIFEEVSEPALYRGKYQDQSQGPVKALIQNSHPETQDEDYSHVAFFHSPEPLERQHKSD